MFIPLRIQYNSAKLPHILIIQKFLAAFIPPNQKEDNWPSKTDIFPAHQVN